ncbi:hypothetical protein EVG20_g8615 [Dentipellis fragilis]|uniref:Uncharacterized protein n=1 Tax=Dentipellis fragilis TaxID=205917 RepID=A0A4Y9Y5R8_9AGAM|nr:hypothetical protein EVG20_g8615 [Dentipellis fragilis]
MPLSPEPPSATGAKPTHDEIHQLCELIAGISLPKTSTAKTCAVPIHTWKKIQQLATSLRSKTRDVDTHFTLLHARIDQISAALTLPSALEARLDALSSQVQELTHSASCPTLTEASPPVITTAKGTSTPPDPMPTPCLTYPATAATSTQSISATRLQIPDAKPRTSAPRRSPHCLIIRCSYLDSTPIAISHDDLSNARRQLNRKLEFFIDAPIHITSINQTQYGHLKMQIQQPLTAERVLSSFREHKEDVQHILQRALGLLDDGITITAFDCDAAWSHVVVPRCPTLANVSLDDINIDALGHALAFANGLHLDDIKNIHPLVSADSASTTLGGAPICISLASPIDAQRLLHDGVIIEEQHHPTCSYCLRSPRSTIPAAESSQTSPTPVILSPAMPALAMLLHSDQQRFTGKELQGNGSTIG